MIRKDYYKACDLFLISMLEKRKKEYFNEYGYDLGFRKDNKSHFKDYAYTNQNNVKRKIKK